MQKQPRIEKIKEYVNKFQPLGISGDFKIFDIDSKDPSGHWNFLIQHKDKKYVFRIIGNETPAKGDEIGKEYFLLKHVEPYGVGPRVYHFDPDSFIEPILFEEYLEGRPLSSFLEDKQKKYFLEVAKLIAKINKIPVSDEIEQYLDRKIDYSVNFETWYERLNDIKKDPRCDEWRKRIEELLPKVQKILKKKFEPALKKALKVFIFESAHIGHCFVTNKGLRFINWEEAAYGDPSFTLSVFLASIENRPDFEEIKEVMIAEYLRLNPISDFKKLVEGRLFERSVSNTIWVLWAYVLRKDKRGPGESSGVNWRFEKTKNLANSFL